VNWFLLEVKYLLGVLFANSRRAFPDISIHLSYSLSGCRRGCSTSIHLLPTADLWGPSHPRAPGVARGAPPDQVSTGFASVRILFVFLRHRKDQKSILTVDKNKRLEGLPPREVKLF
jgi:hypothetical protein